ncbi:hypothetical protein H0G86_012133 [Trichoderma simmonsii]|uniref:Uncharacterized protein n=1 Tax=Trichoderma simmonsii TaxID=1491479 RepID=A0A8G0LPT5_9HYPO|nr:hypothetical protein H0G86_012133 [Trichoderma simmonsii]
MKASDVVVARREAARRLQQDLKLSLGQGQSLPDMLMMAPLAINLLGQIKLLAFSDKALCIHLEEPRSGFQHLQRKTLSSAMIQIVDQFADAFDSAEKNMRAIRMQTNVMFGKTGHVQTILMCLQDPRLAKRNLLNTMSRFQEDMETCAKRAQDTEAKFDTLVKCAGELSLAMADGMAMAESEKVRIVQKEMAANALKECQNSCLALLEAQIKDAQSEFTQARGQYQKTAAKGDFIEISAPAMEVAIGSGSSVNGLVNATINIFKETPKVAIETVKAASEAVKTVTQWTPIKIYNTPAAAASIPTTARPIEQNAVPSQQPATLGIDPALFAAEQIETQLLNLDRLLNEDLLAIVEDGGFEIIACAQRLGDLKTGLGEFHSKHTLSARAILNEALDVTTAILAKGKTDKSRGDHDEWSKKINFWNNTTSSLLNRATKLRSFAASQPGQGFGGSMDSAALNVPPSNSNYSKFLRQRHQKLLITRAAMNEARNNLERAVQKQLQVTNRTTENARALKELEFKEATMEDTKKILRKSIDIMTAMQDQVRQLTGFFNALANIISIVCKGHAEQYLQTIKAGITKPGDQFTLAYSEAQLQMIRESVITLRGHFSFVVHSVDMYQEIATTHINPCIRLVANLPLSADSNEQKKAKTFLEKRTEESSKAIQKLAKQELEAYHRDFEKRIQEIEEEMAALGLPAAVEDEENLKAIEDGVKESGEKISEDLEEMDNLLNMEILDDL